jgi:hypothetical protein
VAISLSFTGSPIHPPRCSHFAKLLVCDLCLLNPAVLVVSGLSEVLAALEQILLSYLVHMHSRLMSLRQGQVHVGPITWEVLPQLVSEQD